VRILVQGCRQALSLLLAGDPEIWEITCRTVAVSGSATALSVLVGLPLGFMLAMRPFRARPLVVSWANAGMGLPPVVVGLWVSLMLWRYGPLGRLGLLYTPVAMVLAQAVIATPLVAALSMAGLQQLGERVKLQIMALGASPVQAVWLMVREARYSLLAAVMAGFGAVVSEVGASMMVGGNIRGHTRVLTTATVLEVSKGNFEVAIALSFILLVLAWGITFLLTVLQQRNYRR